MSAFVEVFKAIFQKIGDFFDIFDLSFFVAGAICLGAVAMEIQLIGARDFEKLDENFKRESEMAQQNMRVAEVNRDNLEAEEKRSREQFDQSKKKWEQALEAIGKSDKPQEQNRLKTALDERRVELDSASENVRTRERRLIEAKAEVARTKFITEQPREKPKSLVDRYLLDANIVLVIIAIYVLGLICFAVGRIVRQIVRFLLHLIIMLVRRIRKDQSLGLSKDEALEQSVRTHTLKKTPYTDAGGNLPALYTRLWAELRESKQQESYALIKRYWVLAATYDGVAMALLVWALVISGWIRGWGGVEPVGEDWALPAVVVLVLASLACFREAQIYLNNQVFELVATASRGFDPK